MLFRKKRYQKICFLGKSVTKKYAFYEKALEKNNLYFLGKKRYQKIEKKIIF